MGRGSSGRSNYGFRSSEPSTALQGSEKQVEWAEDIRRGHVYALQAYYDAQDAKLRENIEKGRRVKTSEQKLKDLPTQVRQANAALSNIKDASWFIDHRGSALKERITKEDIADSRARSSVITNGGRLLELLGITKKKRPARPFM